VQGGVGWCSTPARLWGPLGRTCKSNSVLVVCMTPPAPHTPRTQAGSGGEEVEGEEIRPKSARDQEQELLEARMEVGQGWGG